MKHVVALLAVASLSACAAIPQSEPPRYSYSQQAMIAPGYPVERVAMPAGFEFADLIQDKRRQEHDSPGDMGSANVTEIGVSWVNGSGETAVATVLHQGVGVGSYWQPWLGSDGYEFVGSRKIQYLMQKGPYQEVSGDPASMPQAAPECAIGTAMLTYSRDRKRKTTFTYTEGESCDNLASFGQRDAEALRQRAYQAFGLSRG